MKKNSSSIFAALTMLCISLQTHAADYYKAVENDQKAAKPATEVKWSAAPHSYAQLVQAPVTLIPYPVSAQWYHKASFTIGSSLPILLADDKLSTSFNSLHRAISKHGVQVKKTTDREKAKCVISINPKESPHKEGYTLVVSEQEIRIVAHDAAGAFYGVQTLKQMLRKSETKIDLPACIISDYPAFKVRGFMHDTGRNYQEISSLKEQIDRFADYKLNVFHWHLTDNPAWRPETKLYPQLNEAKNRRKGRDEDKSYSFEQIRDVIAYAKKRHVTIIPELDMPGHSEFFEITFGYTMASKQGMVVLENLIDEFCREIPAEDCPYLHLGADEVRIKDPDAFIKRMSDKVRANKRTPVLWNPGLKPTDNQTIEQLWSDAESDKISTTKNPIIDSAGGYINAVDPQQVIQRYFFWQACGTPKGSDLALGAILCCWPDVNVNDKRNIFRHSPVWSGTLAFSEAIWQGRSHKSKKLTKVTPPVGSEAWLYLREFEARVVNHRDRFFKNTPFPFVKNSQIRWEMSQGLKNNSKSLEEKGADSSVTWTQIQGGNVVLPKDKTPVPGVRYLKTSLYSENATTTNLMIGFGSATRSTRLGSGVPPLGKWDINGGTVFLNGKEIPAIKWKEPKARNFRHHTWHKPPNELPYSDEEFYWTREHVKVSLKKGHNTLIMRVPRAYKGQPYQATCIPVKKRDGRWVEDESIQSVIINKKGK